MNTLVEGPAAHIRYAGDSALLLDVAALSPGPVQPFDIDVNARAIAIAAAVAAEQITGVRDVQPTFRTVAVHFDPLTSDADAIVGALERAAGTAVQLRTGRSIDVPVRYGGEDGPDLEAVAAFARCSSEEVIARHTARAYRVFMLGFLPGFPYLATVDASIAAPRRPSPRLRLARGTVGIAGRQTGIYPQESPGGWQVIGRTSLDLFDPSRERPALLSPGDEVRFHAVKGRLDASGTMTTPANPNPPTTANRVVTVMRPGLLTTIQDSGRWGYQSDGVPVSGPMDLFSHRVANAAVGNTAGAATLETTMSGPELRFEQPTWLAVAGADLGAVVDGATVPSAAPLLCRSGAVLRFNGGTSAARAYIAFDGGVETVPMLRSRATHLLSHLGGLGGRPLLAGDRLPLGASAGSPARSRSVSGREVTRVTWSDVRAGGSTARVRLRVMPGPQAERFPPGALETLQRTRFIVSPRSDRMGYRLSGGSISAADAGDMVSDATFAGALQVPPSGEPILLMADRQTTGGYPQIVIVATADLSIAGQLIPGDIVEFTLCTRKEALAALLAQEGRLLAFS